MGVIMRVRYLLAAAIFLPLFFFFGLDTYLERFEQHSKYLNQLRDTLMISLGDKDNKISNSAGIISSINEGNFSKVSSCLRAGKAAGELCLPKNSPGRYKNISNLELLKGGYRDGSGDYIKDFRESIFKESLDPEANSSFDFNFNFISDNDIASWEKYNYLISIRYGYYISAKSTPSQKKDIYINGGGVFLPHIFYSNLPPIEGGRIRILAISDSFGAGAGLSSMDDSWARELETQLNKLEDKYELVALAHGGAGYIDFLNWVKDGYIDVLDPDIVLLSYFKNDFNLLHDFEFLGAKNNGSEYPGLSKELVFYLQCFEKEDDFIGKSLKKVGKLFPNIYRYYKFSNCGEAIYKPGSNVLINEAEVVNTYKEIDRLIKVPTFLYKIESTTAEEHVEILKAIAKNGLEFINASELDSGVDNVMCGSLFISKLYNCEAYKANIYNPHYNRYYYKKHIEVQLDEIKNNIERVVTADRADFQIISRINKSEAVIVDFLPNTLFVSNVDSENATVGFFKGESYGYGRSSENFCVPFDRKGVILNFNKYLTEGREVKISSEFQRDGLGLVPRGYDSEGRVVFGEAIELKPGSPVTFRGSESIRGVVVVSNNRDCGSRNTEIDDEFLLQVEVL